MDKSIEHKLKSISIFELMQNAIAENISIEEYIFKISNQITHKSHFFSTYIVNLLHQVNNKIISPADAKTKLNELVLANALQRSMVDEALKFVEVIGFEIINVIKEQDCV